MVQPMAASSYSQRTLIVVPAVFLALASLTVVMRLYSKSVKKRRMYADDYLCILALFLTACCYIDLVLCVVYGGLGLPDTELSPDNIDFLFKALTGIGILWGTTVAVVQTSILLLYIRIFGIVKWHMYTCYGALAVVAGWWIAWFITSVTSCIPLDKFWNLTVPGVCVNTKEWCLGSGLTHFFLDIFILTFSLPIMWGLKTSIRTRCAITIACSLGLLATISGLLRLDCLVTLIPYDESDFSESAWLGTLFELLENECGIVCSCMPMFPSVLARIGDTRFGGSITRFFSNLRGTGFRASIRRLLSTQRSSPDRSGIPNSNGDANEAQSERTDVGSDKIFGSNKDNHHAIVSKNDGSSQASANIPLTDVRVTQTYEVQR